MVSVFIDQPFTTRASVGTFHAMSCWASFGAFSSAFLTAGSSLSKSRALAGFDADALHLRDDGLIGDVGRASLRSSAA